MTTPLSRSSWLFGRKAATAPRRCALATLQAFDPLEGRTLLSTVPALVGPDLPPRIVAAPVEAAGPMGSPMDLRPTGPSGPSIAAVIRSLSFQPFLPGDRPDESSLAAMAGLPDESSPGFSAIPAETAPPGGTSGPGSPPPGGHPVVSEANIVVAGQLTSEVALANDAEGTVTVYQGSTVVFRVAGLSHPEAVKLADITDDGTPDLIVADSGANRVLIYAGLVDGGFGKEVTGGVGFAVGTDPVGLSVGDFQGDGQPDLVVSNRGSNTVSILAGQGVGAAWSLAPEATIPTGLAPIRAVIANPDPAHGVSRSLVVCNSGSNDIAIYPIDPGGQVPPTPARIIPLDRTPNDMMLGQFSRRPGIDLITTDDNSGNLTYIGGVFSPHPFRREIATGILNPTAAFGFDSNNSGVSDMMVAGSSGQIAFLQASDDGLVLAGVSAPTGLSNVTAIAAGTLGDGALEIFEASSSTDSLAILRFDLGDAGRFAAAPGASLPNLVTAEADAPEVELIQNGAGLLDLVGILWNGTGGATSTWDPDVSADRAAARSWSTGQALNGGSGSGSEVNSIQAASYSADEDELEADATPADWRRFVLGLDAALDSFQGEVTAVAAVGSWEEDGDRSLGHRLVRGIGQPSEPDDSPRTSSEPGVSLVPFPGDPAGADRSWRQLPAGLRITPEDARSRSPSVSSDLASIALGSGVAVRLLISASPPRPPRSQTGRRRQGAPAAPWPEVFPPTHPLG